MATYKPFNEYSSVTGGGFDNETRVSTSDSNGGGSGSGRSTTLTPVTVKQILDSKQLVQDGPFVTYNQELHHISFVGVVRNITDYTSNIFLTIEDGTGQIEVRKWSEDTNDMASSQNNADSENKGYNSQVAQQYEVGTYVKVYGALKEFSGKKNVQYAVIKNLSSFNEVIAHHLEVIKCHAIANGKLQNTTTTTTEGTAENGQSLFVTDNNNGTDSGDALQKILAFCRKQCEGKDANSFAVPIPLISQSLNIDETTARNCCTTLTEQGFIYPTFDDNHFFAL